MLIFFCLILLTIFLWWIEKNFNLLYGVVSWFTDESKKIREQTKLKINLSKIIFALIVIILIFYLCFFLFNNLYYPYFESVLDTNSENISLKSVENGNSSLIGDWGTFGDFVGGTLNPILTFISICLILFTVYQNKKALDFNSEELALSRQAQQDSAKSQQLIQKTQNLQQFDSLFFSLLNQFKQQQDLLCFLDEKKRSKVDKIYRSIFVDEYDLELEYKRHKLIQNQDLNQYFICLFQLFKLINSKINRSPNETDTIEEWGDYVLEKQYANILRALIPPKLQQLLFLNVYTDFDEYRWYLSYYSFLEHMPFKNLENGDEININVLVATKFYKLDNHLLQGEFKIFGESIYFDE